MSETPYTPFTHLPTEITDAAETLHVFFEKQGMRGWQYSHVADRRLVDELERDLNAAKAEIADNLALIKRLHCAISARMCADDPTDEERVELVHAWRAAQETIDKAKL